MSRTDKLSALYGQANKLNEEFPAELMKKLSLYGQILELIGGLHSEAVREWKLSEATRREAIASATIYHPEVAGAEIKTAADRAAAAEVVGADARKKEAIAEADATRWKNAYNSTSEQIQILKKIYDHMRSVAGGGV
jgi:hypothetical protein